MNQPHNLIYVFVCVSVQLIVYLFNCYNYQLLFYLRGKLLLLLPFVIHSFLTTAVVLLIWMASCFVYFSKKNKICHFLYYTTLHSGFSSHNTTRKDTNGQTVLVCIATRQRCGLHFSICCDRWDYHFSVGQSMVIYSTSPDGVMLPVMSSSSGLVRLHAQVSHCVCMKDDLQGNSNTNANNRLTAELPKLKRLTGDILLSHSSQSILD